MSRWIDPLLVGVLDRLADRHEQLQPLARRQVVVVAVFRDRHAVDQLHDEVGPATPHAPLLKGGSRFCPPLAKGGKGGRPAIENAGDIDVVHHGQRLPLASNRYHLAAVHAA